MKMYLTSILPTGSDPGFEGLIDADADIDRLAQRSASAGDMLHLHTQVLNCIDSGPHHAVAMRLLTFLTIASLPEIVKRLLFVVEESIP